jgi:hypothetical protein
MKSLRPFAFNLLGKGKERKLMIEKENVLIPILTLISTNSI